MSSNPKPRIVEIPDRMCYYCNEGYCGQCTGWDRTIVNGEVVLVACAHECRALNQRKANQGVTGTINAKLKRA